MALALVVLLASACKDRPQEIVVFAAASLGRAFAELEERIERDHPESDVRLELTGSQEACRKVAELNRPADVVAVADYRVIESILRPAHAAFDVQFTTNEIVLAHLQHSRHTEEISSENWPTILLRPGVRLGMADPDLAPIGYATLLTWRLAELHYGERQTGPDLAGRLRARCAPEHFTSDESQLLQLLESRAVDYAFMYRSTAEEHNLKTVRLPEACNLGAFDRAATYGRASVQVRMQGKTQQRVSGAPIVYGITIPSRAPHPAGAVRFLEYLLGEPGQRTLQRTGFRPLRPAPCIERRHVPPALQPLTR